MGLGTSTNNYGELWAIGMDLTDMARKARDGYELPAKCVNLIDSSYVCGCLVDGWNSKGPKAPLVKALLALLRASPIASTGPSSGSRATSACLGTKLPTARPHTEREPAAPGVD